MHTFEPAEGNRALLARNLSLNPSLSGRVEVWSEPLAHESGIPVWIPHTLGAGVTMQTNPDRGDGGQMVQLSTDSVDRLVRDGQIPRVDFLKVDVEGADLGVLEGAAETIRSQRPRIAIACYHRPDDLVTLPDFVASLGVSYRWYLQCSTMTDVDTVAFAVPVE